MLKRDPLKKPPWLKVRIPAGGNYRGVRDLLQKYNLSTVCQEARCPNIAECWNRKSATIMILGKVCTRACRFCAVATGDPGGKIDVHEPANAAEAIKKFGLRYVVITSVDRDDLPDQGSGQYAAVVTEIKKLAPEIKIEVLIPDFSGRAESLRKIVEAGPDVIGHNVETVDRLTPRIRDRRCGYQKSLAVLALIKDLNPARTTKSGFMVGLGETDAEIVRALADLKDRRVDIVTIGQYLQPTKKHVPVQKYYTPDEFDGFKKTGKGMGIKFMVSGPLVRSSYRAGEAMEDPD
jgi:lipoic acid synthetase